jgi:hypothetical protein
LRLQLADSQVQEVLLVLFDQGSYAAHAGVAARRFISSRTAESP